MFLLLKSNNFVTDSCLALILSLCLNFAMNLALISLRVYFISVSFFLYYVSLIYVYNLEVNCNRC